MRQMIGSAKVIAPEEWVRNLLQGKGGSGPAGKSPRCIWMLLYTVLDVPLTVLAV